MKFYIWIAIGAIIGFLINEGLHRVASDCKLFYLNKQGTEAKEIRKALDGKIIK